MENSIKDIGEQGLLKILQQFCPPEIIGDDAAILEVKNGHSLVVTTDVLVDGVHFSDLTTSPEDVGWRCVAANLSDIAAMGAKPLGITVGLGLPPDTSLDWVIQLYEGMTYCLKQYDTVIVGGDICRSSVISVSITALGSVLPNRIISRFLAKPGDAIVITGCHGLSRAGLELLLHPAKGKNLEPNSRNILIQAHQRPKPRLDILDSLWNLTDYSIAGMDSSDGLADAVLQICRCSQVGAKINQNAIPLPYALRNFVSDEQALDYALYGGEDFELVLCLPLEIAEAFVETIGQNAAIIGHITAEKEVRINDRLLYLTEGYQHFSH
ncbi:thiamine-phosphate kinase [Aphanothece hegewaldii CCALA 016]|uniref:Thiamine-monophosphate kinase n=1 Tax=Aphanothece hegewaldii CCALA 016 TaxID=2107694 RepID=A0A2T1LTW9_9CHRO|nr:thiamine-phosphate kinase [Aphanothece hegewaldii]PSF34565.1 thiamine-phosphate kinase [Aphanothece hegewaldii CCALA 016]